VLRQAFPGQTIAPDALSKEQHTTAITTLFNLLDQFLDQVEHE